MMRTIRVLSLAACLTGMVAAATLSAAEVKWPGKLVEGKGYRNLTVEEFDALRGNTNFVLLDVRTPKEFADGHIPGATNIDWSGADFEKKVATLDKTKMFLVSCRSGRRSAAACELMAGKLKFAQCYNLEGGFLAWDKAKKPVQKSHE